MLNNQLACSAAIQYDEILNRSIVCCSVLIHPLCYFSSLSTKIGGGIIRPRRFSCFTKSTHQVMAFSMAQRRSSNGNLTRYYRAPISTVTFNNCTFPGRHQPKIPDHDQHRNLPQSRSHESTTHLDGIGGFCALNPL